MIQIEPRQPVTVAATTPTNNLLKHKPVADFLRSRWYPGIFQRPPH